MNRPGSAEPIRDAGRRSAARALVLVLVLAGGLCGGTCKPGLPSLAPDPMPPLEGPLYPAGDGPLVLFHEAKENVHTLDDLYLPTGELLAWDGYDVAAQTTDLASLADLEDVAVLVIATPTVPYPPEEVDVIEEWVWGGGSLLLVTDHTPLPPGIVSLADAFGVTVLDVTVKTERNCGLFWGCTTFAASTHPIASSTQKTSVLESDALTDGFGYVSTFGGTALIGGTSLLTFGPDSVFQGTQTSAEGLSQGVIVAHGAGRVYVSGEAAMFSNRIQGPWQSTPTGWDVPWAEYNRNYLLRIVHWLDPQ